MTPEKIGQFEIVSELARTESGAVYKATDPKGKTVALRTIRLDAPGAPESVQRFRLEARAASVLSSPNVAGVLGGGEAGCVFFVALEFVEGVKLATTLEKGEALSMSEVIDLCRQVCSGIDHAQSKGIVHHDLKPSNIIVEWDGTAKIMDYGMPPRRSATGVSEGTYYMSPEEARGGPLDVRSNLFSWGAVLYEMVAGRRPFSGDSVGALRKQILEETPPAPHEVKPGVPPRVSEIILKVMAKAPAERYGSGAELLRDLENYKQAGVTPPPTPDRPPAEPRPKVAPSFASAPAALAAAHVRVPTPAPPQSPPTLAASAPSTPEPPVAATPVPATVPERPAQAPTAPVPAATERPAVAAPKSTTPNLLLYVMAGVIVVLLAVVIAGALWMRRAPAAKEVVAAGTTTTAPAPPVAPPAEVQSPAVAPPPSAPARTGSRAAKPKSSAVPEPVTAPVPLGDLLVDSSPQGAEVQIDGRHEPNWITPHTAAGLSAGQHTVAVSMPGHMTVTRTIEVKAGERAVVAVGLPELAATVSVTSDPAGAAVLVDGKDTGKVTPSQLVLAKGGHTITLRKAGYLEASNTMELAPGQTAQFGPTLKVTGSTQDIKTVGKFGKIFGGSSANAGRVQVRTNPKGAKVLVNGQALNKPTPVEFLLEPGNYEVTLSLEGYKPVQKIIAVEKGGKVVLDETLTR